MYKLNPAISVRIPCIFMLLLLTLGSTTILNVYGQRFMRQGFSGNEDFGAEMKLDAGDADAAVGMTREMFLMKDIKWQIPPIEFTDTCDDIIDPNKYKSLRTLDPYIRQHIVSYLGGRRHRQPMSLSLFKKRGKFGLRAIGTTDDGKKLRGFWRQATTDLQQQQQLGTGRKSENFLTMSYDDACKARLFTVEFEIQLPPIINKKKNGEKIMPSVVYQVPVESGSMNPKAIIPRGVATVLVFPYGRPSRNDNIVSTSIGSSDTLITKVPPPLPVGTCRIGVVKMRPGLVDPSWSKGRPIFRSGRSAGIM
jgi:hypothetical protein